MATQSSAGSRKTLGFRITRMVAPASWAASSAGVAFRVDAGTAADRIAIASTDRTLALAM